MSWSRKQLPIRLCYATSPLKLQGATEDRLICQISDKDASRPSLLYVLYTRVKGPDFIVFDNEVPSFQSIIAARDNIAFKERLDFENWANKINENNHNHEAFT